MKLTIDNFDGAGMRDYTGAIAAGEPPRVLRRLNRPSELRLYLVGDSAEFIVPSQNARVELVRADGVKLFTGYIAAPLTFEYLGWGERGPAYRYLLVATSDEYLLDRKLLPERAPMTGRTAGGALKQLAEDLLPGGFDTSPVADVAPLTPYDVDAQKPWSEHAAEIALRTRASYRAHDRALQFRPVGETTHVLDEAAPELSPDGLKLAAAGDPVNDLTVIGNIEPRAYVKDYFLGDGLTLAFDLSHVPFTRGTLTLYEEEFEAPLWPARWSVVDPSGAISVAAGKLAVNGGTGSDGQTTVSFVEKVDLAGALLLQHGEAAFSAASNGILGGLYNGAPALANCVAGFRVTSSGAQSAIQAVINGSPTGPVITTVSGHRYALTTRVYSLAIYRTAEIFYSSAHPAGSGGGALGATVRFVLEVHDIDPANPGSLQAPSTVLFDAVAPAANPCTYALVNSTALHCTLNFARMARLVDAEVRTSLPGQPYRTRLAGSVAEGAECQLFSTPELMFWSQHVPSADERIVVRYRGSGRALCRITDVASIVSLAHDGDDGVRAAVRRIACPPARTSAECESAALAVLDDCVRAGHSGEYRTWSNFLPGGGATDIWPGDAVAVNVPSRAAAFTAIVREVAIEVADIAGEHSRYALRFADDAAEPLAFAFDAARLAELIDLTATTTTAGSNYIADLPDAEITDATSTTITMDVGASPPAGGGIEVRRSDYLWGTTGDRNLVGRFTSRTFTVPRLTRVQDFYLRQYDSSNPPKYSRYSTALHLDYPL